jgi:hypothetical protein
MIARRIGPELLPRAMLCQKVSNISAIAGRGYRFALDFDIERDLMAILEMQVVLE